MSKIKNFFQRLLKAAPAAVAGVAKAAPQAAPQAVEAVFQYPKELLAPRPDNCDPGNAAACSEAVCRLSGRCAHGGGA